MKTTQIGNAWKGAERCENCAIRHLVLFSDLQKSDFDQIHQPIDDISYKPGSIVYGQSDHMEFVYTIRSGLVKLVQYLPDGNLRIVRILGQGELLGIESLNTQVAEHKAITLDPVQLCRIPHSVITLLQQNSPGIHNALIARWQKMLNMADLWITQLSTGKIRTRVSRLLLLLSKNSLDDTFYMPTREDIGNILGITTESASKVTAEFKRNGWLKLLENNHAQVDENKLEI
ncbi:MAG: Crp/Fnr family transcriptional regulator [gamma proteobacterium symbiont of Taylorina sp.]|nr:Crp/Fnr family transcriptional regulator [gamma proteobacterium symbiont of Taylorina sp.]